ncbi:MAG: hypothetical protein L0387_12845 [Acidobacteria bacterium]|nr:hypothetical protein [Acidobacteriota bacterium]MCI0622525.1 hypothetical protein [Acidobacteriota bacterium]MCI0723008.1 hypothetical protein [Acidobacteriota bacterium]
MRQFSVEASLAFPSSRRKLACRVCCLRLLLVTMFLPALNEGLAAAAKDEINLAKVSPKTYYLDQLLKGVPVVMKSFVEETGRFALAGWIPEYQEVIYPLAYLATTKEPATTYAEDTQLINAAMKGGDALCDSQYEDGTIEHLKRDSSSWGRIYPHKLLTAWLETYALLKDRMDAGRQGRWEKGLTQMVEGTHQQILGKRNPRLFSGIFRNDEVVWGWSNFEVNSLSIWDGLNVFRAGQIFQRKDWQQTGQRMIHSALETLDPVSFFWPEFGGPSPSQQLEYLQAIGLYYEHSGDLAVVPYVERGLEFQIKYVYPDGSLIETLDGRARYSPEPPADGHFVFSQLEEGRRFAKFLVAQMTRRGTVLPLSSSLLRNFRYYHEGDEAKLSLEKKSYSLSSGSKASVRRKAPWFYALSGFTAPTTRNRWGLDRQNFVSVWHEGVGLIISGGNSKGQSEWSNFIFPRSGRLAYIPSAGQVRENQVVLTYEDKKASLEVSPESKTELKIKAALLDPSSSATGQLLLHLKAGNTCKTAAGGVLSLSDRSIEIRAEDAGGWVEFEGWRINLPAGSKVNFPSYPFDPEERDSRAPLSQARGVLSYPLNSTVPRTEFTITVLKQ